MRQRILNRWSVWVGAVATVAVAAGSRFAGFALGKAVAVGYAVIVSLAGNFVIDIVRPPADNLLHEAAFLSPSQSGAGARATATLPAPAQQSMAAGPGPGSGGLY